MLTPCRACRGDHVCRGGHSSRLRNAEGARDCRGMLEYLLGAGFSLEERDEHGDTPLHAAARYPSVDGVKALLEFGARRDARNDDGLTPIEIARQSWEKILSMRAETQRIIELLEPTS